MVCYIYRIDKLDKCRTPIEFDEMFSTKILGLSSASELYDRVSCYDCFKDIDIPSLIILSKDDPTFK